MTLKEWLDLEQSRTRNLPPSKQRGTQDWLARRLSCTQAQVSKWVRRRETPVKYAPRIVRLSGGKVTLAELGRVK